ncbi:hypothetical protein GQX74_003332 [Glossina fuscipes]|nr:hypothetical protein GQX74_003332 [Glossina fuscipes]
MSISRERKVLPPERSAEQNLTSDQGHKPSISTYETFTLILKKVMIIQSFINEFYIKYLRPKQVCLRNCKKPSTHRQAPSKQLLLATFMKHCSFRVQSPPKS